MATETTSGKIQRYKLIEDYLKGEYVELCHEINSLITLCQERELNLEELVD